MAGMGGSPAHPRDVYQVVLMSDEITIGSGNGWFANFRGRELIFALIILAGFALFFMLMRDGFRENQRVLHDNGLMIKAHHARTEPIEQAQKTAIDLLVKSIEEQTKAIAELRQTISILLYTERGRGQDRVHTP